jgi:hypothetical protein
MIIHKKIFQELFLLFFFFQFLEIIFNCNNFEKKITFFSSIECNNFLKAMEFIKSGYLRNSEIFIFNQCHERSHYFFKKFINY